MNHKFYLFLKLFIALLVMGFLWAIVDSITRWNSLTHIELSDDMKNLEQELSEEFHCQARIQLNYDEIGKQHAAVAGVRLHNISDSNTNQLKNPNLEFCLCRADSATLISKTITVAEKLNVLLQKEHLSYNGIVIDLSAMYRSRGNLRCTNSLWYSISKDGKTIQFKEFYQQKQ